MRTWRRIHATAWAALAMGLLAACGGGTTPGAPTSPHTSATATPSHSTPPATGGSRPAPPTTTGTAPPSAPATGAPGPTTPPRTTAPPPPPVPSTTTRPRPQPTTSLPAGLRGQVVTRVPTTSRVVALTFDGGAGAQGAAPILATLRAAGVPASFFVTGAFATANHGTTRALAAAGPVGNHSWSHPDFTELSASGIGSELTRAQDAIASSTDADPHPFFRFPFGAYDTRSLGAVNAQGYAAIGWTTDSLGWKGTSGGQSADTVAARVLGARTPGQIVLMHLGANPDDGSTLDADALPRIIAAYRSYGYGFTTLRALLG